MATNADSAGDQFDRSNEGKCCDAIIRLLERRTGILRDPLNIQVNAQVNGSIKNVEARFTLRNRDYAIEHTRIMAFADTAKHRYFVEIREAMKTENLGIPGIYILELGDIPQHVRKSEAKMTSITAWVRQTALELNAASASQTGKDIEQKGCPWGENFPVKLIRRSWAPDQIGMLDVRQFTPPANDLQNKVVKSLDDKCPKLKAHKDSGATSILILEMLGSNINHFEVCDALADATQGRNDLPDEIYIVDSLTSSWFVLPFKQRDKYPESPGRSAEIFDPRQLCDIFGPKTMRQRRRSGITHRAKASNTVRSAVA